MLFNFLFCKIKFLFFVTLIEGIIEAKIYDFCSNLSHYVATIHYYTE